jgi:hypothetical protein
LWFLAVALLATTLGATSAEAYIGPGVGAGAIAAVVGVLGSIFLALFAVIYYPIKRMLKKRKGTAGDARDDTPQ